MSVPSKNLTRRQLLALAPLALPGLHAFAQSRLFARKPKPRAPLPSPFVYFGTDTTRAGAQGIYRSRFDPAAGRLTPPELVAACVRPSYFAVSQTTQRGQTRQLLYTVNAGDAKTSAVTTYMIAPRTGALTKIGEVTSAGEGPCYIAVDSTGRSAYVANYNGGTIASYLVKLDGTLSEPVSRIDFHDQKLYGHHGPNASRQTGPHPHSAMLSPDNRFLIVNDLGNDDIAIFPVDPATAQIGNVRLYENLAPASGPRHVVFHPNTRWVYGIDEISSRIDQYLWTATHASSGVVAEALLTETGHSVSTLDAGFRGTNTAAEVVISPGGNHLYASNRGEDSIAVFTLDETNGAPKFAQRIPCGGRAPRHFTLDNTGHWLICENQDSASVTVFARNPGNGLLTGPMQTLPLESPMFALLV